MELVFRFPDFLEPYAATYKFLARNSLNEEGPFVDLGQTLTFIKGILIRYRQDTNSELEGFIILNHPDHFYSDLEFQFENKFFAKHDAPNKQIYYADEKNDKHEITFEILFDLLRHIPIELIKIGFVRYFEVESPRKTSLTTYPIIISFSSTTKQEIAIDLKQMLLYSGRYCDMCSESKMVSNIHVPLSCSEKTSQCLQVFIEDSTKYKELFNTLSFDECVTMWRICDFLGIEVDQC